MFRFAHKEYLLLLALLPVFTLLYLLVKQWKKKAIRKIGLPDLVNKLSPDTARTKPLIKFVLLMLGYTFVVIGIADPQIGTRLEEVKRKGVDVIIALDVSNSMKAEDIRPSRLERAKQSISRLVDNLQGDRIGLIVFAGNAYVQLPITTDYGAAKLFLNSVDCDMVPTQGTAIGAAIDLAIESFGEGDTAKHNKTIIVITDGENHEDDAVESAKKAAEKGMVVSTIGMGSESGAPIPVFHNGVRVGFMQDESGQPVVTKLDAATLHQIADAGKDNKAVQKQFPAS